MKDWPFGFFATLLGGAIAAIILSTVFYTVFLAAQGPPIQWSQDVYEPMESEVCPGQELEINLRGNFRGDGVTTTIRAYRDATTGRSVGDVVGPIYRISSEGVIEGLFSITVPDLPPGSYELISWTCYLFDGSGCRENSAATFSVFFEVPNSCIS